MNFLVLEAASFRTIFVRLDLKRAFAGLIADRAIERMVDEDELENVFLSTAHQLGCHMRFHNHAIGRIRIAGRHQFRKPTDHTLAVLIQIEGVRFFVEHRHACFHITLAAVRRNGKGWMVAEMRKIESFVEDELQHFDRAGELEALVVDENFSHYAVA